MATRTVGSGDEIRPFRGVRIKHYPEMASQTFKRGDPLIYSTVSDHQNEVGIAGSDPVYIMGYAAEDASGTQGTDIGVYVADSHSEFCGVVQSGGTLAYTNLGVKYGLVADGTNHIWRVDLSETTAAAVHCHITELLDPVGTVNGRVAFRNVTVDATGIVSTARPYGG
jgi:hypothetical protein